MGKADKRAASRSGLVAVAERAPIALETGAGRNPSEIDLLVSRLTSGVGAYLSLALLTTLCLWPFCGRAFHVDDTLFVWAAQQIHRNPFDPYGFQLVWDVTRVPMSRVTQNPPLASYFAALIATLFGWSEKALHGGFLLIAVALVLGTFRLATSFTKAPFLAAVATLLTPGVLVSASSVMCDTMMLALWMWAVVFWVEGIERNKLSPLFFSSVLIAASALTKYFGIALIPLLLTYTVVRRKRVEKELLCLLIPVAALVIYQIWSLKLYGHGLLTGAAEFASVQRAATHGSPLATAIVGLSFAGGCALVGWTFALLVWTRAQVVIGALLSAIAASALLVGWLGMGLEIGGGTAERFHLLIGAQLIFSIGGGISLIALTIRDFVRNKDAASLFLALSVLGTFVFASLVNYTVNARSVLPLIPGAAILVARRLDEYRATQRLNIDPYIALTLVASAALSLWIVAGDSSLANSARSAAFEGYKRANHSAVTVWFEGHWGFQYYMESLGGVPIDFGSPALRPGDYVIVPENNIQIQEIPPQYVTSRDELIFEQSTAATTISHELGAGFYSSYWGPLPYSIGPVGAERYWIIRLGTLPNTSRQ